MIKEGDEIYIGIKLAKVTNMSYKSYRAMMGLDQDEIVDDYEGYYVECLEDNAIHISGHAKWMAKETFDKHYTLVADKCYQKAQLVLDALVNKVQKDSSL